MDERSIPRYRRASSSSSTTRMLLPIQPLLRTCGPGSENSMAPGETMSSAPARKAMARKGKRDGTLGRWWVALSFMRSISSRILLHEQPMMDGKQRQLEPVGGAHLVEDVRQVVLDR